MPNFVAMLSKMLLRSFVFAIVVVIASLSALLKNARSASCSAGG
jgi:hypothetical protein